MNQKQRLQILKYSLLMIFSLSPLSAGQGLTLPIHDATANTIEFQSKQLSLEGEVVVTYDMGIIHCDHAVVSLDKKSKEKMTAHKIDLKGHIVIDFADGSSLTADRGEICCDVQEAVFYGSALEKVRYSSFCTENELRTPILVSGKKMFARISKDAQGKSTLSNIRGEGSVTIEYSRPATKH